MVPLTTCPRTADVNETQPERRGKGLLVALVYDAIIYSRCYCSWHTPVYSHGWSAPHTACSHRHPLPNFSVPFFVLNNIKRTFLHIVSSVLVLDKTIIVRGGFNQSLSPSLTTNPPFISFVEPSLRTRRTPPVISRRISATIQSSLQAPHIQTSPQVPTYLRTPRVRDVIWPTHHAKSLTRLLIRPA